MSADKVDSTVKYARWLVFSVSVFYILYWFFSAIQRLKFPFVLEWMEGDSLEHVRRILAGKGIYNEPSLNFLPHIYTPLYYYLSAGVSLVFGANFFSLRLVSLLATTAILVFIFLLVRKETGSSFYGIIASGLYSATYRITDYWFELARVDSLYICFFIGAIYFLRKDDRILSFVMAGIFAALAIMTKHTSAAYFIPIGLYLVYEKKGRPLVFGIVAFFLAFTSSALINYYTHGWFYFLLVKMPAAHKWGAYHFAWYWMYDLFKPFAVSIILSVLLLFILYARGIKNNFMFWLVTIVTMVFVTLPYRLHDGSNHNTMMPVYVIFSVAAVIGLYQINRYFKSEPGQGAAFTGIVSYSFILAQFLTLMYPPREMQPLPQDYAAGRNVTDYINHLKGDVLVSYEYTDLKLRKREFANFYMISELMLNNKHYDSLFRHQMDSLFKNHVFSAVIGCGLEKKVYPDIDKYYYVADTLIDKESFLIKAGYTLKPEFLYLPRINGLLAR